MRCLMTLLACGWFLMMPPETKEGLNYDKPISKWKHIASFDTAAECENSMIKSLMASFRIKAYPLKYWLGRCVPSDAVPIK